MAKKKPDFTEQQIVSYLLSGGNVEELSKNTRITTNQILNAIVNNPQVFTKLKSEAQTKAEGLNSFNPNVNYASPDSYIPESNPISEHYGRLEPDSQLVAKNYVAEIYKNGNNPAYKASLDAETRKNAIASGMDEQKAGALVNMLSKNADEWFKNELQKERKNKEIQFKAFEAERKSLDLKQGDDPVVAAMSKLTGGYGKLAEVINPDVTWEQMALESAGKNLIKTKGKAPKGGFTNVRQAETALNTIKSSKDMDKQRKEYIQGYLNVVAQKLPKGQTPYATNVKKLIPYLQSNNPFGK